jgi:hypothetical protein
MKRILLVPLLVVAISVVGIGLYSYSITAQTKNLSDIALLTEPIYPQATVSNERMTAVGGQTMTVLATSDQSETIDRSGGIPKEKFEKGRATIELGHGLTIGGNHIISATITNTSKEPIYLINLIIVGGTDQGIMPITTYVVDPSYTPELFGKIPKPAVIEPIMLISGQSYSGYITGNWNAGGVPIDSFSVGAVFEYDIKSTEFVPDDNWSMYIAPTKIQ